MTAASERFTYSATLSLTTVAVMCCRIGWACLQYKAELLLQGVSDKEIITLLPQAAGA